MNNNEKLHAMMKEYNHVHLLIERERVKGGLVPFDLFLVERYWALKIRNYFINNTI